MTAGSSIFIAILLLHAYAEWPLLYMYFFVSTLIVATATYVLRIRFFRIGKAELQKDDFTKMEEKRAAWKAWMPFLLTLLAALLVPMLLSRVLDPKSWFILIVSLTSGISIAEIVFYFHV